MSFSTPHVGRRGVQTGGNGFVALLTPALQLPIGFGWTTFSSVSAGHA